MARPLWEKNSWHWSDQSQIYRNPQKSKWQWCCLNLSSHFPQSHIHVAFCFVMGAIGKSHDGAAVRCPESSATPSKHTHSLLQRAHVPLCWATWGKMFLWTIQAHRNLFRPPSPVGHTLDCPPSQTLKSISKAPSLPSFHFPLLPRGPKQLISAAGSVPGAPNISKSLQSQNV